jgi:hypothetical protein
MALRHDTAWIDEVSMVDWAKVLKSPVHFETMMGKMPSRSRVVRSLTVSKDRFEKEFIWREPVAKLLTGYENNSSYGTW